MILFMKALCDCDVRSIFQVVGNHAEWRRAALVVLYLVSESLLHLPFLFHRSSTIEPHTIWYVLSPLHPCHELILTLSVECCLRYPRGMQATTGNNLNCHVSPQALIALACWKFLELAALNASREVVIFRTLLLFAPSLSRMLSSLHLQIHLFL